MFERVCPHTDESRKYDDRAKRPAARRWCRKCQVENNRRRLGLVLARPPPRSSYAGCPATTDVIWSAWRGDAQADVVAWLSASSRSLGCMAAASARQTPPALTPPPPPPTSCRGSRCTLIISFCAKLHNTTSLPAPSQRLCFFTCRISTHGPHTWHEHTTTITDRHSKIDDFESVRCTGEGARILLLCGR